MAAGLFDVGGLPPWMIQRETPTDSLVKGIAAGSQIAHNILGARQFALQQQESIIQQQNQLRMREGLAAFGSYMGNVKDWASPEAEAGAYKLLEQNPWLGQTPAFQAGINNFKTAQAAKDAVASRELIARENAASRELIAGERNAQMVDIAILKNLALNEHDQAMLEKAQEMSDRGFLNNSALLDLKSKYASELEDQKQLNRIDLVGEKTKASVLSSKSWINRQRAAAFRAEVDSVLKDPLMKYNKAKRDAALQSVFEKYPEVKDSPVMRPEAYQEKKSAAEPALTPKGLVPGSEVTPVAPSEVTPTPQAPPPDAAKGVLTPEQANAFLKAAGGDEEKATALAVQAGYKLPSAPAATKEVLVFDSEDSARKAGHSTGAIVIIKGVGKVRLK